MKTPPIWLIFQWRKRIDDLGVLATDRGATEGKERREKNQRH